MAASPPGAAAAASATVAAAPSALAMGGEGSAAGVLRPRAQLRRSHLARRALALAAVPLVAAALLRGGGLRAPVGEPPATLPVADALLFVSLPGGWGLLHQPCGRAGTSQVAREAGYEGKPGGRPGLDVAEPPPELDAKFRGKREATFHDQEIWLADRAARLKKLKGKFVPWGPKPWDKHRFMKVCISVRLEANQASNTKIINQVVEELRRISGVHPWICKAKHNVARFNWRKGMTCGAAVTMYGGRMYDFLHRLNTIVLPRVRDFEGLIPNSFDKRGNFWMGLENQEPFKELDELIDNREIVHGFDIGIINSCLTQYHGLELMKKFGFPFGDPRPRKIKVYRNVLRKGWKKKGMEW